MFQFLKGSIKASRAETAGFRLTRFNSYKVRLKPITKCVRRGSVGPFNSLKVRIKLGLTANLIYCLISFQFLNGSIKACVRNAENSLCEMFQFLNGSIKAGNYSYKLTIKVVLIPQWFD